MNGASMREHPAVKRCEAALVQVALAERQHAMGTGFFVGGERVQQLRDVMAAAVEGLGQLHPARMAVVDTLHEMSGLRRFGDCWVEHLKLQAIGRRALAALRRWMAGGLMVAEPAAKGVA